MSTRRRARGIAAHHVEWLRLIEFSGPFLSLAVLADAFPQGLDVDDPAAARALARELDAWDAERADPGVHLRFVRFVLTAVLEHREDALRAGQGIPEALAVTLPGRGVTLRPDLVVRPEGEDPALLVMVHPPGTALERPTPDGRLTASPAERLRLLLRGTGVRSGLVTNGEDWMLVHVPAERTATFAAWSLPLALEERITLRALRSLLGARRVVGQAPGESLDGLLERSLDDEREVTDALGDQARRAVEVLVGALDAADRAAGGRLLAGVEAPTLYEAGVATVMRIIFLLAAEAQGLLPDDPPWSDAYAVAPLRPALEEAESLTGGELLDRQADAWGRLVATFRAVHEGVPHDRVRLPGYGGGLFDPARFPFLDGAGGPPPRVSNRAVLRVLDHLQTLHVRVAGHVERRPLSFRALGVEQVGHVYERLLEHTAVRAEEPALGLAGAKGKEPETALRLLEEHRERGGAALLEFLVRETGRSESALRTALAQAPTAAARERLRAACGNDEDLLERVVPFAGLVRDDPYGRPTVFLAGTVYVTERAGGRAFQSHYTPPGLTEEVVRYALEPVVYAGPAEGRSVADWRLRPPAELLGLKVADIAMGSGAFLVAACRYLAARLVESWAAHPAQAPGDLPADPEERDLVARRLVAERCLYGVDKNPLAVEIAKVSMWLTTLRRDRPFTFLDHALRAGDSLVGVTDLGQLGALSLSGQGSLLSDAARERVRETLDEVRDLRVRIAATDAVDLAQVRAKADLLARADRRLRSLRAVADLVAGAALATAGERGAGRDRALVDVHAEAIAAVLGAQGDPTPLELRALEHLNAGRAALEPDPPRPFHWPLELPEVFAADRPGFDAIVGNPPFLGGQRLTGTLTEPYREHLVERVAGGRRGSADLCAYFFLRAAGLLAPGGALGLLATNTIGQGDTREVGLARLEADGAVIYRATPSRPWPGLANLEIAQVWTRRGPWDAEVRLDGRPVAGITTHLTRRTRVGGDPRRLAANAGRSFQGSIVLGMGFVLAPEEAAAMIARDPRNRGVLFPYLIGEDIQSRPDQSPSRWVINFFDWPLERAREYPEPFAIVERLVRPERARNNRAVRRERWWQFAERAPGLYAALDDHPLAFARSLVSSMHAIVGVERGVVFSHAVGVFTLDDWGELAALQSSLHEAWVWRQASSLETRVRYTPSDCFETFTFPDPLPPGETAKALHDLRAERTRARGEGLTKLANRVNDPAQADDDLVRLRALMAALDRQVAAAYGWGDLDLDHGFHATRFGRRFTLGPAARDEVLDRLLELNHARHADEVARGLHAKGARSRGRRPRAAGPAGQVTLPGG